MAISSFRISIKLIRSGRLSSRFAIPFEIDELRAKRSIIEDADSDIVVLIGFQCIPLLSAVAMLLSTPPSQEIPCVALCTIRKEAHTVLPQFILSGFLYIH